MQQKCLDTGYLAASSNAPVSGAAIFDFEVSFCSGNRSASQRVDIMQMYRNGILGYDLGFAYPYPLQLEADFIIPSSFPPKL